MDDDADTSTTTTRALDTPVSLIVDGCICDKTVADVREAVQQVRDAHQHTLLLEIASDGGSCYAVLAIVDMLRAWLAEAPENAITTYATRAFSAALCLFVLGTTRVASPLASFMNHPASGAAEGDVVKMRQELVEAERVTRSATGCWRRRSATPPPSSSASRARATSTPRPRSRWASPRTWATCARAST